VNTIRRTLVLAAAVVAAACTADGAGRQLVAPEGRQPHFTITSSTVTCPDTISVGQSAQCTAYFYDENHNLVSTTPTWGTNTSTLVSVSSTGVVGGLAIGLADVRATAGSVTGSKSVYVKPGISLYISGPSPVLKLDPCRWGAVPSGGTPPYTYQWTKLGGAGTASGAIFDGYAISGAMTLTVKVTDANGVWKSVSRQIIADATAPNCF
jgi:hypothetical protein